MAACDSTQLPAVAERLSISLSDHHPGLLTCIGKGIIWLLKQMFGALQLRPSLRPELCAAIS